MEEPRESPESPLADAVLARAEFELDADELPVLGPWGQRVLLAGMALGVIVFLVLLTWLLGYLAYTKPPVPGSY